MLLFSTFLHMQNYVPGKSNEKSILRKGAGIYLHTSQQGIVSSLHHVFSITSIFHHLFPLKIIVIWQFLQFIKNSICITIWHSNQPIDLSFSLAIHVVPNFRKKSIFSTFELLSQRRWLLAVFETKLMLRTCARLLLALPRRPTCGRFSTCWLGALGVAETHECFSKVSA